MSANNTSEANGSRSLCLNQISFLQEKLERTQLKCKEIAEQKKELCFQYKDLDKFTRDSIKTLKSCLADRKEKLDESWEKHKGEQQSAQQYREEQELELHALQELFHRQEVEMSQQDMELEEQKGELMYLTQTLHESMADLEKQLADQEEANKADIHKLKMETELKLNSLEVSLSPPRKKLENQTVVKMREILADQQEKLHDQQVKDTECSHQLDMLLKDISKCTQHSESLCLDVKQLTERFQKLQMDIDYCSFVQENAENKSSVLRQDLTTIVEAYNQEKGANILQQTELDQWTNGRKELECVRKEAIIVLRHILTISPKEETIWKTERLLDLVECATPNKEKSADRRNTRKKVQIRGLYPLGRIRQ